MNSVDKEEFCRLYPLMRNDELAKRFSITKKSVLQLRKMYGLRKSYRSNRNATADRFKDPRYQVWRLAVLSRDGFRCTRCAKPARDKTIGLGLDCHHIKSWSYYPNKRFDPDNGMALCRRCHKRLHRRQRKKS